MKFEVIELKSLGTGLGKRLSIRLKDSPDPNMQSGSISVLNDQEPEPMYTIHAVVPFHSFKSVKIGDEFHFVSIAATDQSGGIDDYSQYTNFSSHPEEEPLKNKLR